MQQQKILFLDRDGTLIKEPVDQQVDHINKFELMSDVISSLQMLKKAGFIFVMITNQDGLGTTSFSYDDFILPQQLLIDILASQGIQFADILICPHFTSDNCDCRKPKLGLVLDYMREQKLDCRHSYVIGDRETDMILAKNMGIQGILFGDSNAPDWSTITNNILMQDRTAMVTRKTNETEILVKVNLDQQQPLKINTSIGFLDHMLEQLAKHGGFSLILEVKGDLHIDDHHTVEDTAIALGEALRIALADKVGIARYGFLLPMDEALAQVALDLSGRSFFIFNGKFYREKVGELSTELVSHFFRSFAEGLKANLHINIQGDNTHHMVEAIFKAVGRSLRQAKTKVDLELPSTKGVL